MTTINITLPEEMKAFVEAQMAADGYASASEYLRALIHEAQERQARRELDARLLEGIQSPASELTDEDWAGLRKRISELTPQSP